MHERTTGDIDLSNFPALKASREFSRAAIAGIGAALEASITRDEGPILTVAAAGSLGRLEATRHSDVDCIVIVDDEIACDAADLAAQIERIAREFPRIGLKPPKAGGIYCRPISVASLLDPGARGSLEESPAVFGTRMQLLLDAGALFRVDRFNSIREQLVDWYGVATESLGSAHLVNDLSRYLHAYAVWQQFKFSRSEEDAWFLRQAKLRSTRVATFAGLLFLLGESTRRQQTRGWLLSELARTPLGRLRCVFDAYPKANFIDVVALYEELHAMLADAAVRRELIRSSPTCVEDVPKHFTGAYATIHELSERLMRHLTDFVLARRDDWSPRIFRNWLL